MSKNKIGKKKANSQKSTKRKKCDIVYEKYYIPTGVIDAVRFTYDAWMKCFPESDMEEWKFENDPMTLNDYVENVMTDTELDLKQELPDTVVKIITFDDEYFKWLKNQSYDCKCPEDYQMHIAEYRDQVTSQTALRLLRKNNMN